METWLEHKIERYANLARKVARESGYDEKDEKLILTISRAIAIKTTDEKGETEIIKRIEKIKTKE